MVVMDPWFGSVAAINGLEKRALPIERIKEAAIAVNEAVEFLDLPDGEHNLMTVMQPRVVSFGILRDHVHNQECFRA